MAVFPAPKVPWEPDAPSWDINQSSTLGLIYNLPPSLILTVNLSSPALATMSVLLLEDWK